MNTEFQKNHTFLADCEEFNVGFPLEYTTILKQREDMLTALRCNRDHFGKYFRYIKDELRNNEFALRLLRDLYDEYDRLFSVGMDAADKLDASYKRLQDYHGTTRRSCKKS